MVQFALIVLAIIGVSTYLTASGVGLLLSQYGTPYLVAGSLPITALIVAAASLLLSNVALRCLPLSKTRAVAVRACMGVFLVSTTIMFISFF